MCVDDYEFRHSSANREKQCRRFVFRTQDGDQRVFLVNISQFQQFGELRLCEILMHLSKKGLNVKDYRFYLPKFQVSIEAGDQCQAPFSLFSDKEIVFQMHLLEGDQMEASDDIYQDRFGGTESEMDIQACGGYCGKVQPEVEPQLIKQLSEKSEGPVPEQISQQKQLSSPKKPKQLQKTIRQALIKTKQWRALHQKLNVSLKNAANMVGISKKTLDDYFLAFRVAEFHDYNLKDNMDRKIGHMRAFIRNQEVKVKGRLPKQIKSFQLIPQPDLIPYIRIKDWSKIQHIEEEKPSSSSLQNQMISE